MGASEDESLPRWGGITEPMTVLTDVLLGGFAFILAARLGLHSAAEGVRASSALAGGLLAAPTVLPRRDIQLGCAGGQVGFNNS